jgi:hypothetical protein
VLTSSHLSRVHSRHFAMAQQARRMRHQFVLLCVAQMVHLLWRGSAHNSALNPQWTRY